MNLGVFGKIIVIVVAIVAVLWIYDLCVRAWMKYRNREEVKKATAKVVFKEVQTSALNNERTYSVCFLTVEGMPVEVYPNEAEYNAMEVGQKGELTYQGYRLIRFEQNK